MSATLTQLSNPTQGERVPLGTFIYFRSRNQQRLWETIVSEFERSGISQAELHRRTGRDPSRVCDFLGSPGNWEADTISDYLFAMSGAELEYRISHPLEGRELTQKEKFKVLKNDALDPEPIGTFGASGLRVFRQRAKAA